MVKSIVEQKAIFFIYFCMETDNYLIWWLDSMSTLVKKRFRKTVLNKLSLSNWATSLLFVLLILLMPLKYKLVNWISKNIAFMIKLKKKHASINYNKKNQIWSMGFGVLKLIIV